MNSTRSGYSARIDRTADDDGAELFAARLSIHGQVIAKRVLPTQEQAVGWLRDTARAERERIDRPWKFPLNGPGAMLSFDPFDVPESEPINYEWDAHA